MEPASAARERLSEEMDFRRRGHDAPANRTHENALSLRDEMARDVERLPRDCDCALASVEAVELG